MIKPVKNTRRINAAKKAPEPDPAWAEAFMILLLAKAGGKVSMSLDRLKTFAGIQGEAATQLDYDKDTKTVTLKLHEKLQIKKSEIITPDKRIIT